MRSADNLHRPDRISGASSWANIQTHWLTERHEDSRHLELPRLQDLIVGYRKLVQLVFMCTWETWVVNEKSWTIIMALTKDVHLQIVEEDLTAYLSQDPRAFESDAYICIQDQGSLQGHQLLPKLRRGGIGIVSSQSQAANTRKMRRDFQLLPFLNAVGWF